MPPTSLLLPPYLRPSFVHIPIHLIASPFVAYLLSLLYECAKLNLNTISKFFQTRIQSKCSKLYLLSWQSICILKNLQFSILPPFFNLQNHIEYLPLSFDFLLKDEMWQQKQPKYPRSRKDGAFGRNYSITSDYKFTTRYGLYFLHKESQQSENLRQGHAQDLVSRTVWNLFNLQSSSCQKTEISEKNMDYSNLNERKQCFYLTMPGSCLQVPAAAIKPLEIRLNSPISLIRLIILTKYNFMKGVQCSKNTQKPDYAKKHQWKRLFRSRLIRRQSLRAPQSQEEFEFEKELDRMSQETNDVQINLNYFDFTFVEQ